MKTFCTYIGRVPQHLSLIDVAQFGQTTSKMTHITISHSLRTLLASVAIVTCIAPPTALAAPVEAKTLRVRVVFPHSGSTGHLTMAQNIAIFVPTVIICLLVLGCVCASRRKAGKEQERRLLYDEDHGGAGRHSDDDEVMQAREGDTFVERNRGAGRHFDEEEDYGQVWGAGRHYDEDELPQARQGDRNSIVESRRQDSPPTRPSHDDLPMVQIPARVESFSVNRTPQNFREPPPAYHQPPAYKP